MSALDGWIDICRTGTWLDAKGRRVEVTDDMLAALATGYKQGDPAPVVIGHPETDDPAWGWIDELRVTRVAYVGRGLVPMSFSSTLGRYLHFILPLAYELDLISIAGDNRVASFTTATDLTRRLYHSGQLAADAGDIDVLLRVVEAA